MRKKTQAPSTSVRHLRSTVNPELNATTIATAPTDAHSSHRTEQIPATAGNRLHITTRQTPHNATRRPSQVLIKIILHTRDKQCNSHTQ